MLKTRYFKGKRFIPVATPSGSNLPLIKICQEGKRYTAPPVIDSGLPKITINQTVKNIITPSTEVVLPKIKIYQTAKRGSGEAIAIPTPRLSYNLNGQSFNGSNNVSIAPLSSLQVGTIFTLTAWVRPTTLTGGSRYVIYSTRNQNSSGSWQLEIGSGNGNTKNVSVTGIGTWVIVSPNNSIDINNWYHVAYVRDGTNQALYADNVALTPIETNSYSILNNSDQVWIGRQTSSDSLGFIGSLGIINLYPIALTATQIDQVFQSERSIYGI
jgi:hypothetical protein